MAMRPAKTEDTQTDLATQRTRARDEAQKELDGEVTKLVAEWKAAGSPATGIPNRRYEVDDVAEAKRRVNRAFTLASKDMTPKLAPMWYKDGTKDSEGYVAIKFAVRVSTPSDKAAAAAAETATPKADGDQGNQDTPPFDPNADQEGDQGETEQTEQTGRRGRFARQ